jgi:FlaA1/EpsC-like NDP-sugar epimerase
MVRSARYLGRRSKKLLMLLTDAVAMPAALWTALTLRFGTVDHPVPVAEWLYVASVLFTMPVFVRMGLYRAVVRFMGVHAAMAIGIGVAVSTALLVLANQVALDGVIPLEVFAIYFALALLYVGATRFGARELMRLGSLRAERVAIYGAGAAGAQLCASLVGSAQFRAVAMVDDNPAAHGARVGGLHVYPLERLQELRRRHGIHLILLAMPSATRRRRSEIVELLGTMGFKVLTVPDIREIVTGRARLEEVRDIEVHDLLGRDPVPPNTALLGACVRGKSILVTGAGGSIGSELCRQILDLHPRRLVLLEVSELALYDIERELRSRNVRVGDRIELVALLGNAHHKQRVREIMTTFGIQTVYHAAAYRCRSSNTT